MEIEATRLGSFVWYSKIQTLKSKIQTPSWAVLVGVFVLAIYLALLPTIERTWRTTGDEPHYLLAAHSLVDDGDFDLTNNYADLDYLNFYLSKDITPQIRLGSDGQQILDHQLALPVLIAPAYALAGRGGALVFQAVLGGLLAGLTFKLALFISRAEVASLLATLFVALSPPLLMYHYLIYPELLGALLTTLILYYALSRERATTAPFILILFALITLPWLNRRFVPLAILLALLLIWAWRTERLAGWQIGKLTATPPLILLAATLISIAMLIWFDSQFTKVGLPDITAPTLTSIVWDRLARGLVGWLVDQQRGLFIYAPIYILATLGAPFLIRDSLHRRSRNWFVMLPFLLSVGVTTLAGGFWIAWELGPRFLVVALPGLAPLLALAWRTYKIWGRGLALLLFGLSLVNTVVILQNPELPYKSSLPLYYGEKLNLPLTEWLPDLAGYKFIQPTAALDSTAAQVIEEEGRLLWLAPPGGPISIIRTGPLPDLPFGHYQVSWPVRVEAGLPPETELLRLSLKLSGGGQIFNKIITAADLPADGSFGQVKFAFRNPNVDRWRTPPVFTAASTGASQLWAGAFIFTPAPFYALFLPYFFIAVLLLVALGAWFRQSANEQKFESVQLRLPQGALWGLTLILPLASLGYFSQQLGQSDQTYPANALNHFVGRPVSDTQAATGQAWLVDPQVDPPQKAIYGPFDIYEAGRYHVTFRLKVSEPAETNQELARLQVAATTNYDDLITQPLRSEHFAKPNVYHDFVLTVTNPRRQALSFEVYYLGVAPLLIDQVTIARAAE